MTLMQMYQRAIKHWGKKKQLNKAIEELKELRDEIKQAVDNKYAHKENITNEITDVVNMIRQLQIIFKITNKDIDTAMRMKMQRTMARIDEEETNNVDE